MISRRSMLFGVIVLVACRGEVGPLDPVWGKQPCDHCQMIVSQRSSAAQLLAKGERHYFDDIGCMVQWLDDHEVEHQAWVRLGDGWVEAERALYQGGASTPMDHGYVASASGIDWRELQKRVLARAKGTP
jgi:copper chaperone NosL